MFSKVGRLATFFSTRYVNVCDITVHRNVTIFSKNVCKITDARQISMIYPMNCSSWKRKIQSIRTLSAQKRETTISSVDYNDIKELPKHPEKLLIDVREPQELKDTGTIPTSINIPLESVLQVLAEDVRPQIFQAKYGRRKPTYDDELIFTCKSGKRAHKAAEIARAMGFTNLKYYAGSWDDWVQHEIILFNFMYKTDTKTDSKLMRCNSVLAAAYHSIQFDYLLLMPSEFAT
ncbi:uncharacterized protein [Eurosta solidaginis]